MEERSIQLQYVLKKWYVSQVELVQLYFFRTRETMSMICYNRTDLNKQFSTNWR